MPLPELRAPLHPEEIAESLANPDDITPPVGAPYDVPVTDSLAGEPQGAREHQA